MPDEIIITEKISGAESTGEKNVIAGRIPVGKKFLTSYGYCICRPSPLVVVAPHAAGDDWHSGRLARRLAKKMGASLVVNLNYIKPDNPRAKLHPELVEDFNQLRWSHIHHKYLWRSKNHAMREFYRNIRTLTRRGRKLATDKKAVVVYIHGMRNNNYGLDLGVGLKFSPTRKTRLIHSAQDDLSQCSGLITMKIGQLKRLYRLLSAEVLSRFHLGVSIGRQHIGWSKKSANQYHKHEKRHDYAIQLEVSRRLRQRRRMRDLIPILSDILLAVFNHSTPC